MAKMKVVTYENLVNYDTKIKNLISIEDAKSIKVGSIDGHILKLYKVENPTESTVADIEIELPETDLTEINSKINANANAISAINNETNGILATAKTYADGKVSALKDGEVKSNTDAIDILNGSESTTGSVAKAVKDAKDSINATIGTVEEGKTVVQMISEAKESATYDDTQVNSDITALSNRVKTVEDDYVKSADIPSLDNYLKTEDVSAVATSGSYNDLNDKPEFETVNINFTTEY